MAQDTIFQLRVVLYTVCVYMWLVNILTNEEGWNIVNYNLHQQLPCSLLVFVQDGGAWRTKLWMSNETRIRAKNHSEEIRDNYTMIQSGFTLGFAKEQLTMQRCLQCDREHNGHFSQ